MAALFFVFIFLPFAIALGYAIEYVINLALTPFGWEL